MRLLRYPLQISFWQQVLKYYQRTLGLSGTRLVSLAILDGFMSNGETVWVDKVTVFVAAVPAF